MVGGNHIDGAVREPFQQRLAVRGRAQGRVHFKAPVLLQIGLVQQEVMRRRFAGDVHTFGFRAANQVHALFGRNVIDVIGAAGFARQRKVALSGPPLAFGADARVPCAFA